MIRKAVIRYGARHCAHGFADVALRLRLQASQQRLLHRGLGPRVQGWPVAPDLFAQHHSRDLPSAAGRVALNLLQEPAHA